MPKITRKTQKIFASTAESNEITAFGTAKEDNPTYTTDVAEIFNANFQGGWSDAIEEDKAPFEEDTNGLCYALSTQLAYIFQQGVAEWDSGTTYYVNSLCTIVENNNLIIKRSTSDNNIGNDPAYDNINWVDYYSQKVLHTIGDPIITLSNTLNENEIWLEGSTVSRTTYANLFAIYGTTYGAGDGSTTFKLPDFRNRAIWGADNYGYVAAGIPSLTATTSSAGSHTHTKGSMRIVGSLLSSDDDEALVYADNITATGALRTGETKSNFPSPAPDVLGNVRQKIDFDTDRSGSWSGSTSSAGSHTHPITVELSTSGIMGNSTTIQPPSIKVRVKTRYQ